MITKSFVTYRIWSLILPFVAIGQATSGEATLSAAVWQVLA
jgi:hypothetical protein